MSRVIQYSVLFLMIHLIVVATVSAEPPVAGEKMPELSMPVPPDVVGQESLGLKGMTTFSLADLRGDLIVLEVIGVYCSQCIKQAPGFNDIYARLSKGKMQGRVQMFALAAGGTEAEVRKITSSGQYLFPAVADENYSRHKMLGEPRTPYTIICRPDGSILYTHLGVIENVDDFYQQIKTFLR